MEPRLDALIGHAELLVDRVVAGECRVGGLSHLEHVEDVVVFEELEETSELIARGAFLSVVKLACRTPHLEPSPRLLRQPDRHDLFGDAARWCPVGEASYERHRGGEKVQREPLIDRRDERGLEPDRFALCDVAVATDWGFTLAPAETALASRESQRATADESRGYSIARREDGLDFMAQWPGYGEQRWYSDALGPEQVSFSWRRMLPGTGGRGSYGHRHPGQEEVYFVISGVVTFKVGDDVFEAGPQTAVRMTGDEFYSVHNDTDTEAALIVFSTRLPDPPTEQQDDFWP